MALKFRRGTTTQKSGSLAFGEPFVNTDLNTLQIGGLFGDITLGTVGASSAFVGVSVSASTFISGSTLKITQNAVIDGNTILGVSSADTINIAASITSSLIPSDANMFSIGSQTKYWKGIYVSTGSIHFVDGNGNIVSTISSNESGDFNVKGQFSGSGIIGIGNVSDYSSSVYTRLNTIETKDIVFNLGGQLSGSATSVDLGNVMLDAFLPIGVVSGSSQILGGTGIWSSSAQMPAGVVSGSSQVLGGTGIWSSSAQMPSGVVSSSAQLTASYDSRYSLSSSVATIDATQNLRLNSIESATGSYAISSSVASVDSAQNLRLNSIEGATGSYSISSSAASALSGVSSSFATTISNLDSTYATDTQLTNVSSSFATTISNLGNTYATDTELTNVSSSFATTISNLGNTYATDSELSSVSGAIFTRDAGQDTRISSIETNYVSASVVTTLSSSVNSRLITIEGKDIIFNLGGQLSGSATSVDLGTVTLNAYLPSGVYSSSAQLPAGTVSGSSQVLGGTGIWSSSAQMPAGVVSSSAQLTSSYDSRYSLSSSVATIDATQNLRLNSIESATGSYAISSSAASALSGVSSSFATTISNLGSTYATDSELSSVSGAIATRDAGQDTRISSIETNYVSASVVTTLSSSVNSRLVTIETKDIIFNLGGQLSGSATSVDLGTVTLNAYLPSGIYSSSAQLPAGVVSGSSQILGGTGIWSSSAQMPSGVVSSSAQLTASYDSRYSLSSSVASIDAAQNQRLNSIESVTGSYAITGSNIFYGTQTITGSLYVNANLVVQGSSSLQNITASAVDIGTNIIKLNTATPAVRFGGLQVVDSGSTGGTGSFLWDSINDRWIYSKPTDEYTSAIMIAGPKNSGSVGDEVGLTVNRITVASGDDHIDNSIMLQSAGKITTEGNFDVTGAVSASTITGIGNVTTYSSSVNSRLITIETKDIIFNLGGQLSGSATSVDLGTVTLNGYLPTNVVSGSSQLTASLDSRYQLSGSAAALPAGVVSSSAQLTSSYDTRYALSSSAASALSGVSSSFATTISNLGSTYATDTELTNVSSSFATTISNLGSTYATDTELTNVSSSFATSVSASNATTTQLSSSVNSRLVTIETKDIIFNLGGQLSGSATSVDLGTVTLNGYLPAGVVSGSVQVLGGTGIWSSSAQMPAGVVSSSTQVLGGSGVWSGSAQMPAGVVSSSAQLTSSYDSRYSVSSSAASALSGVSSSFATTIGNLDNTYATDTQLTNVSSSFATTISNLGSTYATDTELTNVSSSFATTIGNLDSTYATDTQLTNVSSSFATTIGNLGSTYATDTELTNVSSSFATTISNLGNTYATDSELSSVSGAIFTRDAGQDTRIASLETNYVSASTVTTLSSSVNTRLITIEGKDIIFNLGGQLSGSATSVDLGTVTLNGYLPANVVSGSSQITLSSTTGGSTASDVQFGSLGIGTAASGVSGEIRATADITAFYSSDIRLKENIKPIENALDKVMKISGNTFDWKYGYNYVHSHTGHDIGVIAQEVEKVLPELVTDRETGYKAVQYEKLVAVLIEAVKEQQKQIDDLKTKLGVI